MSHTHLENGCGSKTCTKTPWQSQLEDDRQEKDRNDRDKDRKKAKKRSSSWAKATFLLSSSGGYLLDVHLGASSLGAPGCRFCGWFWGTPSRKAAHFRGSLIFKIHSVMFQLFPAVWMNGSGEFYPTSAGFKGRGSILHFRESGVAFPCHMKLKLEPCFQTACSRRLVHDSSHEVLQSKVFSSAAEVAEQSVCYTVATAVVIMNHCCPRYSLSNHQGLRSGGYQKEAAFCFTQVPR